MFVYDLLFKLWLIIESQRVKAVYFLDIQCFDLFDQNDHNTGNVL